jgi:hypothetical protein
MEIQPLGCRLNGINDFFLEASKIVMTENIFEEFLFGIHSVMVT